MQRATVKSVLSGDTLLTSSGLQMQLAWTQAARIGSTEREEEIKREFNHNSSLILKRKSNQAINLEKHN